MKTYFSNVQSLDELRKQYRDLLKKYHPDNGGSEEETKAINVEYERLFKILKDKHTRQQDNTNTYQHRKEIKDLGFKFAGQKKSWYWHSDAFRKKSRKKLSMDDIRNYYGSTEVETDAQKRIGA